MTDAKPFASDVALYVIRHGETDWNAERRYQGQADVPLNDNGRLQAARNGKALADLNLAWEKLDFVASPLGRARETMEIVRRQLSLPVNNYSVDPALMELSYGAWQGTLQSDLPTTDPQGWSARSKDPYHWRPDGGESYADLVQRTKVWLDTVTKDSVVVAHGGTLRCLHRLLLNVDAQEVPTVAVPQNKLIVIRNGVAKWI